LVVNIVVQNYFDGDVYNFVLKNRNWGINGIKKPPAGVNQGQGGGCKNDSYIFNRERLYHKNFIVKLCF
jgi:hypothetical protein